MRPIKALAWPVCSADRVSSRVALLGPVTRLRTSLRDTFISRVALAVQHIGIDQLYGLAVEEPVLRRIACRRGFAGISRGYATMRHAMHEELYASVRDGVRVDAQRSHKVS